MNPEWSDFKILIALSRGGSVAGAARELGVDSSTVSRRLAALEGSVGACLIVRGGREFAWTAVGRTLLQAAESMEALVVEAMRAARAATLDVKNAVRISCAPGLIAALTRLLPALHEKQPGLAIEFSGENRAVDLAKGEADIALRMFPPTEPGLVCLQGFELGWAVYASEKYLAEHGKPASPEDLQNHRLVRYVASLHRVPGPRWLEEHRGTATGAGQVDNTEVAAHVVASAGGVGVIPCAVADVRPDMVRVFPEPVAHHTGFIVYHESARDTACVRAAVEALAEVLAENSCLFSGRRSARG